MMDHGAAAPNDAGASAASISTQIRAMTATTPRPPMKKARRSIGRVAEEAKCRTEVPSATPRFGHRRADHSAEGSPDPNSGCGIAPMFGQRLSRSVHSLASNA